MNFLHLVAAGAAFSVSLCAVMILRPVLRRYAVVDSPTERSSHTRATLRGGGVAPLLGVVTGISLALFLISGLPIPVVSAILGGTVLAAVIGLVEDVRGLPILLRAAAQMISGAAIAVPLAVVFAEPWWVGAAAAFAIMLFINVANFMDGINGISGVVAALIGTSYATIGAIAGLSWASVLGLIVAAAFLGFLPWNLSKPGLFLGDVGSYLLGAVSAALAFGLLWAGLDPLVVVAPLAIYLADTLHTLARRAWRGEAVLQSHRSHAYQRLTDTGLSHVGVTSVVALFTLAAACVGLLRQIAVVPPVGAGASLLALCALYLMLPRIRGNQLPPVSSLEVGAIPTPAATPARPDHAPRTWAVVGATGFVGSAVAARLRADGFDVREMSAPRLMLAPTVGPPALIVSIAEDNVALASLSAQFAGVDVVVNAAGLAAPGAPAAPSLYGANALLPALIAHAANAARVGRVVHLSSAAVQGRRAVLDDTLSVQPFSPYSHSKALGERAFLNVPRSPNTDAVVIRATSVQGVGRPTTESLKRIARSPLASVAGDGSQPTVVSSIEGLTDFVVQVSKTTEPVGPVMLQPWEGMSTAGVLRAAKGTEPVHLPRWFCRTVLQVTRIIGHVVPEVAGAQRRVELMWFGQRQTSEYERDYPGVRGALEKLLSS